MLPSSILPGTESTSLVKQRDEIKGKDEALKALTLTLLDKGKENQKLSEMILEIKNHQLETQILGQKFFV